MTETTTRFDAAEHLDTPEGMAAFMDAALETGDSAYITHALGVLAKAKGMTALSKETGISRDTLYGALKEGANPGFGVVMKVMGALGLRLAAEPKDAAA